MTLPSDITLTRPLCTVESIASQREWLVTNGLGSYACGTVSGIHSRRYHGYLMAALNPPAERTLLVSKVEEVVHYRNNRYELGANRWVSGVIHPTGYRYLESFSSSHNHVIWRYRLSDALLEKHLWMDVGSQCTRVRYVLTQGTSPVSLTLNIFVGYRNFHTTTRAGHWLMGIESLPEGIRVHPHPDAVPLCIQIQRGMLRPEHNWYRDLLLEVESQRGQEPREDILRAASAEVELAPSTPLDLSFSAKDFPEVSASESLQQLNHQRGALLEKAGKPGSSILQRLTLAADQFIVQRRNRKGDTGRTVIAGYPWFGDWGRDTMIALPGLALCTGRPEIAREILLTFADSLDHGLLPNRFPDIGEAPEYNTVDATLWFFEALHQYVHHTHDKHTLEELYPRLLSILDFHQKGTRYNIHQCPHDALLYAGVPGKQLTWMDAKVGDWVVTPRIGKPVEINALWYNAWRIMESFALLLGHDFRPFADQADRIELSFQKFWKPDGSGCFDVLESPTEPKSDPSIRPNQLLAVSLTHSPLTVEQQKAVVDQAAEHLYTPMGMRTLSPSDPQFKPHFRGVLRDRDAAYHQGTIWPWLLGPFCFAHHRVYKNPVVLRELLQPMESHLEDACLGSISEIFEAEEPHRPEGCFAQAWSVAEILRVNHLLEHAHADQG